jgi:hypothetical protein
MTFRESCGCTVGEYVRQTEDTARHRALAVDPFQHFRDRSGNGLLEPGPPVHGLPEIHGDFARKIPAASRPVQEFNNFAKFVKDVHRVPL